MITHHSIRVVNTSGFKANLAAVGKSCPWALGEGRHQALLFSLIHDILMLQQLLQYLYNANPSDSSEFCSQKLWFIPGTAHQRCCFQDSLKEWNASNLLYRCNPSELSLTHQSSSLTASVGNFSAQSPSPIAELIVNGPAGDKRHSKDLEISSGWLFSWASDWASIVRYNLPYLYYRVPDTRV